MQQWPSLSLDWRRKVQSPLEFCEKGGLSEHGKAQFLDAVKSTDKDEIVAFAWRTLASKLGHAVSSIASLLKTDDLLIKTFLCLDKYGVGKLSAEQLAKAQVEIQELLRVSLSSASRISAAAAPDFNTAAEAFSNNEMLNPQGRLSSDGVLAALERQHSLYSQSYISPYTTIVGPSGIGKSFAVGQLAIRHGTYVMYNNLAPATSKGFPRPVSMGATPIEGVDYRLLQAVVTAPGLFNFLTSNNDRVVAARVKFETLVTSLLKSEDRKARVCQGLAAVREVLQQLKLNNTPTASTNSKLPVIICFDEARALLDGVDNRVFRSLRKAGRKLADSKQGKQDGNHGVNRSETVPFFMALLDTTSKISNFTPPIHHDPSAKVANLLLFHPIYQIDSLDAFAPKTPYEPSGKDVDVKQIFSYGRPLWGAFLKAGYSWKSLLGLASSKMSGYKDQNVSNIAVLSYRMNLYISLATMAKDLVASLMCCLVAISPDRNVLITAQPSEPVLAFAAAKHLQDPAARLSCIRSWISGLHSGAINPGDIGEQVASVILLFAVSLGDFIASLLGKHVQNDLCRRYAGTATGQLLQKGTVFFNHFVRTSAAPTLEVLENAYQRGAALFLPAYFPGMDVALPVRATPRGPLALLLLQVNNRKADANTPGLRLFMTEDLHKAVKHLGVSTDLHSVVGLAMCLRTQGDSQFVPMEPSKTAGAAGAATAKTSTRSMVKGKEKAAAPGKISSDFLGIAFGLDATVYPYLQPPSGKRKRTRPQAASIQSQRGKEEMEAICQLLGRLVNSWPNAYADEDTESTYAQRLLDPFYDIAEAADKMSEGDVDN